LLVEGRAGMDDGVQPDALMILSASRKFLKRDATSRSWRKRRWKRGDGSVFQAIVSVIAVKIQLSSPMGVFLSLSLPGMRSTQSGWMPCMDS
jgi:hypothetical protein